ncbi:MAG: phosphatidate cytidylyltransferase [Actinomycetota bacterium]
MTDRDRDKDELFEDLDKFFAPIQDVDWPEPEAPATEPSEPVRPTPAEPTSYEEPTADEPAYDLPGDAASGRPERRVDIYAETQPPGSGSAELSDEEPDEPAGDMIEGIRVRPAGQPTQEPQADLFDTADPVDEGEWPFSAEAEVEVVDVTDVVEVVEPVEAQVLGSEPQDEPDIAAAAEHFAASVRAETGQEAPSASGDDHMPPVDEPPASYPTEELDPQNAPETEQVEVYATETVVGEPYDVSQPFAPATEVEETLLADLDEGGADDPVMVGGPDDGPSWQEPTSVEVGGAEEGRGGGRDVPAAFLTGVVLAAVALGSLAIGSGVFAIVASALVLLAQGELYWVVQKRHLQPATIVGLATGALVLAAGYYHGEAAMLAMIALGTFATFLWYMTVPAAHRKHIVVGIASTLLPVIYVAGLAGYALITLALPEALDGRALMISVIGLTFVYDTAAFAIGSVWGSRPLAQSISPKKSWEGAIGATLIVIIVAVAVLSPLVDPLETVGRSIGLAIVVAIFAPIGDLAESLIKRDLDVKDMGSILPGHGGVLDRIDSLLFVAPAAFLYFRIFL